MKNLKHVKMLVGILFAFLGSNIVLTYQSIKECVHNNCFEYVLVLHAFLFGALLIALFLAIAWAERLNDNERLGS